MVFGQVVIGPPGSGKTSHCNGMPQFLRLIGRNEAVISLDPADDSLPKLTKELCEAVEDYGLVNFTTLDIQDKESVGNLVKLIEKSIGFIFAGLEPSAVGFSKIAIGPVDWDYNSYGGSSAREVYKG